MPGSGKSRCGKALASNSATGNFYDTDTIIETVTGFEIKELFSSRGETYFRDLENHLVDTLASCCSEEKNSAPELADQLEQKLAPLIQELDGDKPPVISTGGGLPIERDNMERLKQIGWTVYLDCKIELLGKRLEGDQDRPLLSHNIKSAAPGAPDNNAVERAANNERVKLITALLREREPIYRTADITVDTSFHTPESLTNLLVLKFSELTSSEDFGETV